MPAPTQLPPLVETQSDLDQVCELLTECTELSVDTEFVRTSTYAPHLGLLQLNMLDNIACIDPLADMDMQAFWALLFDPARQSIVHSAKQDMEVLWFEQQRIISSLLDTQICAGLVGHPAQIGYAGLVKELLGHELSKTQTRTDWSRRPLSKDQLDYAAEDVEYLPEMKRMLESKLSELGRLDWALADSATLCNSSLYEPAPATAWQRVKSIPFLSPDEQARARALAAWREERAVQADRPRQWIISDKALLNLAAENPSAENQLHGIEDLPPPVARKQGQKLITIITEANDALASGATNFTQLTLERGTENALTKKLMKLVRAKAEELGIAAEVLASKRDVQALIRNEGELKVTSSWRNAIIGQELQAAL